MAGAVFDDRQRAALTRRGVEHVWMDFIEDMGGCRFLAIVVVVLLLLSVVAVVVVAGLAWGGWIG